PRRVLASESANHCAPKSLVLCGWSLHQAASPAPPRPPRLLSPCKLRTTSARLRRHIRESPEPSASVFPEYQSDAATKSLASSPVFAPAQNVPLHKSPERLDLAPEMACSTCRLPLDNTYR